MGVDCKILDYLAIYPHFSWGNVWKKDFFIYFCCLNNNNNYGKS